MSRAAGERYEVVRRDSLIMLVMCVIAATLLFPERVACGAPLKVLVSGFETFGGFNENPTEILIQGIDGWKRNLREKVEVHGIVLPVSYRKAWPRLQAEIARLKPDVVLSLGFHPAARDIRLERIARNRDGGVPDNENNPKVGSIIDSGPDNLESGLPLEGMVEGLSHGSFPVSISRDAGNYLCNHLFYELMHYLSKHPEMKGGFVHLPGWSVKGERGLEDALVLMLDAMARRHMIFAVVEFEPVPKNIRVNLARIEQIVKEAARRRVGFVVFPEMALSGLSYHSREEVLRRNPEFGDNTVRNALRKIALTAGVYLGIGFPDLDRGELYNGYRVINPTGETVLTYRKNHLYGSDHDWAVRGMGSYPHFETRFGKFGVLICHDVVYRESYQQYIAAQVGIVIVGANWIGDSNPWRSLDEFGGKEAVFLFSDRKGKEDGVHFKGHTGVVVGKRAYPPSVRLADSRAALYAYFKEGP